MKSSLTAVAFLMSLCSAQTLLAKEAEEPLEPGTISIIVPMELQNDWTTRTSPGGGDRNDLWTKIEPVMTYQATEELSFVLGVTLEQVATPDRGQDEAFEKHGLFLKTLTANYETGPVAVYAGKFTPNFGRAWETGPGIYGNRFAKDYEFAERWGAGGSVTFEDTPLGDLEASASFFMVDRTVLSDSWLSSRGRTRESDGGSGNTDNPRSLAIAIDGSNLPVLESLEYHLGYTQQAKGQGDTGTMRGVVAGAQLTLPLIGELEATPLF